MMMLGDAYDDAKVLLKRLREMLMSQPAAKGNLTCCLKTTRSASKLPDDCLKTTRPIPYFDQCSLVFGNLATLKTCTKDPI